MNAVEMLSQRKSEAIERFFRSRLRLSQLRLLVAIAEQGQLKRVAEALSVTPPAISKQVTELEAALGQRLFQRTGNRLLFTDAGRLLTHHAREILSQIDRTRTELDQLVSGCGGSIGIGAVPTLAPMFLPHLTLRLNRHHPSLRIRLREGNFDRLAPMLEDGTLDVFLARDTQQRRMQDFHQEDIRQDPAVIVCGTHHSLARLRKLSWQDLQGIPWILPLRNSSTYLQLEALLATHGLAFPAGCMESVSYVVNASVLKESQYVSLFSQAYASSYLKTPLLTALDLSTEGMHAGVKLLWRKDNTNSALDSVLDVIRQQFKLL